MSSCPKAEKKLMPEGIGKRCFFLHPHTLFSISALFPPRKCLITKNPLKKSEKNFQKPLYKPKNL